MDFLWSISFYKKLYVFENFHISSFTQTLNLTIFRLCLNGKVEVKLQILENITPRKRKKFKVVLHPCSSSLTLLLSPKALNNGIHKGQGPCGCGPHPLGSTIPGAFIAHSRCLKGYKSVRVALLWDNIIFIPVWVHYFIWNKYSLSTGES